MSDAESLGAQDRIPREATSAARASDAEWGQMVAREFGMPWSSLQPARIENLLEAAYPLIRRAVCQELAEALRNRATYRRGYLTAAEFVESYGGASPGGE